MRGDGELGREFAERSDARPARVGFDAADVGIADTLARQLALAEPELESPPTDPVTNGCDLCGGTYRRSPLPRGNGRRAIGPPRSAIPLLLSPMGQVHDSDDAVEIVREMNEAFASAP